MLAGLYVVRCYISCLPRLCSVLLHGEKKHKKWFMNINEQAGIPNLKAHYAQRTEGWAACHRSTTVVNTNMHIEAFHRLLKVVYLENKQNRRLDHLLCVLLRLSRDKTFERIAKLHKGEKY